MSGWVSAPVRRLGSDEFSEIFLWNTIARPLVCLFWRGEVNEQIIISILRGYDSILLINYTARKYACWFNYSAAVFFFFSFVRSKIGVAHPAKDFRRVAPKCRSRQQNRRKRHTKPHESPVDGIFARVEKHLSSAARTQTIRRNVSRTMRGMDHLADAATRVNITHVWRILV